MNLRIHWDPDTVRRNVSAKIHRKVKSIELYDVRDEIAGEYAMRISKYVPYKTGRLLRSARVDEGAVIYSARVNRKGGRYDYAPIQYYSDDSDWNRSTPDTYSFWNYHLNQAERQDFYEAVADILKERMNNA